MDHLDDDGGGDSGTPIRSISDVPEVCRKEMADFLRAVEPIVSSIDWSTATMADFQAIADEFEADVRAGRLDDLADPELQAHATGQTTKL